MKNLWTWIAGILAIFAPIKAAAIVAIVLVIADLITGVLAARKQGIPITSAGLKSSVGKLALYEIALILSFLAQTYLTGATLPVESLVATVIGLTELKSIAENLDIINGSSLFKSLVDRITQSNRTLP